RSEKELYEILGLDEVPAELREGGSEAEAAAKGLLPELVEPAHLRGILHVHTTYSDGIQTLAQVAQAAQAAGFEYLGVSDHSRSAAYAGGLSIKRIEAQAREIRELNEKLEGFRILHGIESDILPDGSLDYPDEVLAQLDFVIASVHSGFRMDRETMTARIVKAVKHPMTCILGHPTGRLLLGREAYDVDLRQVLEACAEAKVMVEINANPHRLDLDWRHHQEAVRLGLRLCINPDAHRISGLDDLKYGIGTARKGWLQARDVANCLTVEELLDCWRNR
ncbi:MAG: PHP domain-containing protein, partial [Planctomycetes bacterium]|nr:PHP domain-containing protein [Planctomycetota bacterium]